MAVGVQLLGPSKEILWCLKIALLKIEYHSHLTSQEENKWFPHVFKTAWGSEIETAGATYTAGPMSEYGREIPQIGLGLTRDQAYITNVVYEVSNLFWQLSDVTKGYLYWEKLDSYFINTREKKRWWKWCDNLSCISKWSRVYYHIDYYYHSYWIWYSLYININREQYTIPNTFVTFSSQTDVYIIPIQI